jgi:dTDP-4-amino-4,6-dideoxygalactose transaminase
MNIKSIGLIEQNKKLEKAILNRVAGVIKHSRFIAGEEVEIFERRFAQYCGVKYAIGVNSGTDALILSMKTLRIGEGDEVITVPNSFIATVSSIIAVGATPVLVDVDEEMNISPEAVETAITHRTKAIIPVHLTGKPCRIDEIKQIAKNNKLFVIEDAAQAAGGEWKKNKLGSLGDLGCFSLHPLKNLNVCGDGGIIITNNEEWKERLLRLRNHGLIDRDHAVCWGLNSRLDSIQAAIGNIKLDYLDYWVEKRREIAAYYAKNLADPVRVPTERRLEKAAYHTYVIRTPDRDRLMNYLIRKGIEIKIHYPVPIHLQEAAKSLGYKKSDFPIVEKLAGEILSLPVYPELSEFQINYIIDSIHSFYREK